MFQHPLFFCILSALCFGTWPILSKFGGVSGVWYPVAVSVGTLFGTLSGVLFTKDLAAPSARGALIVLAAGALNGIGFLFYGRLVNWKGVDLSRTLPLVTACMPLVTSVVAMTLLHEPFTLRKGVGIVLVTLAAWALS